MSWKSQNAIGSIQPRSGHCSIRLSDQALAIFGGFDGEYMSDLHIFSQGTDRYGKKDTEVFTLIYPFAL